jgi:hypothetical protein
LDYSYLKLHIIFRHFQGYDDNKTSLLHSLQAQTLLDATPPVGQIHPFCKMAETVEPLVGFRCPLGFRKFLITMK